MRPTGGLADDGKRLQVLGVESTCESSCKGRGVRGEGGGLARQAGGLVDFSRGSKSIVFIPHILGVGFLFLLCTPSPSCSFPRASFSLLSLISLSLSLSLSVSVSLSLSVCVCVYQFICRSI